jgi:MFS family permease
MSALLRPAMLAPFRVRNFRFQWPADLVTACAFEMETLILAWYILVETGSVVLLTLFGALQYAGTLFSPLYGVAGDRMGNRSLLCGMRAIYTLLAASLMTIAFLGALTPLIVFLAAALMGLVRPSDLGVRTALTAESMPPDSMLSAMGIARTTVDAARIVGALTGAGLFAAFGMGWAYVFVAGFYLLGLLLTLGVAAAPPRTRAATVDAGAARPSPWRELREGLAYVRASPRLLVVVLLALLVNFTAYPLSNGLLPYVAREVYGIDQTGLGYLVAGFATGALTGSLYVSLRGARHPARTMIVGTLVWYALLLVFAQMQDPRAGFLALVVAGFFQSFCMVTLTLLLVRESSEHLRSRVIGVRMLAIYSLPFGLLGAGALIERIGFSATASLYAIFGLAMTALIAVRWRAAVWDEESLVPAR